MKRRLALIALSGWLGYHLRAWAECKERGAWVRTEQGMQCRGRVLSGIEQLGQEKDMDNFDSIEKTAPQATQQKDGAA